ncbi:MAG: transporter, partial [Acidobacteria bacterium]|nr:transporter [Acidobacteriota bacterium]
PTGLDFLVFFYSFSTGNVVVDPSVPIEDLQADIHSIGFSYLRTFGFAGRSASVSIMAPYIHMSASALLNGQFVEGSRTDWADARVRLTVNLVGGPAMPLSEFARFKQRRTLGIGLTVSMPTGQYSSSNLINFGANRWGFKPEIGYSSTRGNWVLDLAVGAWFFTTNNEGFGGTTRKQDPLTSVQGHLSYNFSGGVWLALDGNYFAGGQTSVDGSDKQDRQKSSRVGLTLSIPLKPRHSLRLAVHSGAFTRVGADFDIGSIAYQFRF